MTSSIVIHQPASSNPASGLSTPGNSRPSSGKITSLASASLGQVNMTSSDGTPVPPLIAPLPPRIGTFISSSSNNTNTNASNKDNPNSNNVKESKENNNTKSVGNSILQLGGHKRN